MNKKIKLKNLTLQDVAQVIENWTKIPVKKITEKETQKLLNLEANLHKRLIGQERYFLVHRSSDHRLKLVIGC